ncbi:MAG TPA: MMPL family transporter [Gaiellaceae bacterium]|nr:MMPL family transporter [Gaiellaceae bacterium]
MAPLKQSHNFAARMGRWSANHWKTAVFGWLAFVVASVVIGGAVGTKYLEQNDLAVGEARTANTIVESGFPEAPDEQGEIVLIQSKTLEAEDPAFRAAIADVVKTLDAFPQVRKLDTPLEAGHADLISDDKHSAMVQFSPKGTYDEAIVYIETLVAAVDKVEARHPGFEIQELGSASTGKATDEAFGSMLAKAGMIALPLTLVILLFVFGSAVAALLPLLLAITAVIATTSLVAIPSHFIAVDESIAEVILLIGLAVGIDYSLFYLRREREERRAGRSEHAALEAAAATSGRAVLISGITVLVAMAGMFLSGDKTFMSFSIGTMMVVAIAMIGSLTVLPALLAKLGDRVEKGRVPFLGRLRRADGESRFWNGVLDRVLRRPVVSALAAGAVLVALTVPAFSLNTTTTGIDDIAIPEIEPFKDFEKAFPGGNDPAIVAIKATDVRAEPIREAIAELERRALSSGQMKTPIEVEASRDNTVATVDIPLAGTGTDAASQDALATLRDELLPQTLGQLEGVEYAVTGTTALDKDWEASMLKTAPLVFGFVLIFAFLILLASFRSIVVALKAIVLNLLSVGAAYGILVMLFQWGWGESLLGFQSNGGITPWLPIFLFVILFGLSMDYHVFILSRIREAYDRGLSNEEAVAHGIKTTAGVVTSAAVVMVGTFSVFALLPVIDFKEMGIGLAAAVLIDATLVRAVLLPATMKLLGERNWYLPTWLEWLPRLEGEAPAEPVVQAEPARAA